MKRIKQLIPIALLFALTSLVGACPDGCPGQPGSSNVDREKAQERKRQEEEKRLREEAERQAQLDGEFSSMRQCHANIEKQTQFLDKILENVNKIKCLGDSQKVYLEESKNQLFATINAFSLKHAHLEPQNRTSELNQSAQDDLAPITAAYDEIQAIISFCRTEHILKGAKPSPELSGPNGNNLFLVALGDIFGEDSGFEGSQLNITLSHRLHALKIIQTRTAGQVFIKDDDQAHPCRNLGLYQISEVGPPHPDISQEILGKLVKQSENALVLLKAFEGPIGDLQAEMSKQLRALKKGESLFLPLTWSKHAFAFEMTRENDDDKNTTYTFRIFNSGQGINTYHAATQSGYNTQYFPFLEMIEVPQQNLTSFAILKAFQEVTHPETYASKPEDIYEKIIQQLGGKSNPKGYDVSTFKDPQLSGTCAYFSLPWVLDSAVEKLTKGDEALNKGFIPARIEYLIGSLTLKGYAKVLKDKGITPTSEQELKLLQKGLTFFSAQTAQSSVEHALDFGDLGALADLGESISSDIKVADSTIRAGLYQKEPISIASGQINFAAQGSEVEVSKLSEIGKMQASVSGRTIVLDFTSWKAPVDKDLLISDLEKTAKVLEEAQSSSHFVEVLTAISDIALRLPLAEKDYWKSTSDQQASKLIGILRQLQKTYVFSLTQAIAAGTLREMQFSTTDFLVTLKLLALADLLNTKYLTSIDPKIPSLNQKHFAWVLSDKSALIEVKKPEWVKQLEELRRYFSTTPNAESFFGLDQIPAGVFSGSERRIFHDKEAVNEIKSEDRYWTDELRWPDFEWTLDYMKKTPGFSKWEEDLKKHTIGLSSWSTDYISPFTFGFDPNDFDRNLNPSVKEKDPVPRIDAELVRREAMKLLAGDKVSDANRLFPKGDRLPSAFYDLRALSFLADFLLTGQIDKNSVKNLSFSSDLDFQLNGGWAFLKVYTGESRKVLYKETQAICTEYETYGYKICKRYENKEVFNEKEIKVYKFTVFKASKLKFTLFGGQVKSAAYADSDRKKEEHIDYIHAHRHAQRAFKPFAHSDAEYSPASDFHHDELMKIYMTGVVDKNGKPSLDPLIEQERRRILPNEIILKEPSKEGLKKLTLERIRAIFTLSSDKDLQLTETLALFNKFPSLLFRPEYQRLFEKLMFEPGLIQRELEVSPIETERFMNKLVEFCNTHLELFKKRGNIKAMAFILQMNQLFKIQWEHAYTQKETKRAPTYRPDFFNTPQELYALTKDLKPEQWKQRSYLYRNIVESYAHIEEFTKGDIELLLFAAIQHNTLAITDEKWEDAFIEAEVRNLLIQKQPQIQKIIFTGSILSPDGKDILKGLAKTIRPDLTLTSEFVALTPAQRGLIAGLETQKLVKPSAFEASAQGPGGVTKIQIDITGSFYDSGQTRVRFPLTASEYETIFGSESHPDEVTQIGYKTYEWTGGKGNSYRLQKSGGTPYTYQMRYKGKWYQFIPDSSLDFEIQGFFSGYDHWQSVETAGLETFLIFDHKTKELAFTTTARCTASFLRSCTVETTTREKDKAILAHLDEDEYPKAVLSQIETPEKIYVWLISKASKQISEVDLPKLGLHFRPLSSDPNRLDCASFEGYGISDTQYSGLLHQPLTYLVCDPIDASKLKRLAISPAAPFEMVEKSTTLSSTQFGRIDSDDIFPLVSYQLPLLKNGIEVEGSVEPSSDLAKLYLALRELWQLEYRKAKLNIEQVTKSDRKLSQDKGELRVLTWLFEGREDNDPRAAAVQLLAAINLLKQNRYFGASWDGLKEAQELYIEYLANIRALGDDWISYFDEYLLASALGEKKLESPEIRNRMAVLKARHPRLDLNEPKSFVTQTTSPPYSPSALAGNPYDSLLTLRTQLKSTASAGGAKAVLDAGGIITMENFDLLYDIAHGRIFDEAKAKSLLKQILSDVPISRLSHQTLREEWLHVFALNTPLSGESGDLARFLTLLARLQDRSELPTASDIRSAIAQYNNWEIKFHQLQREIQDLHMQELSLKEPIECEWQYRGGSSERVCDPSYRSKKVRYDNEKNRLEQAAESKRKEQGALASKMHEINSSFDQRLFAKLNAAEAIKPVRYEPVIHKGELPARQPVPIGAQEPGSPFEVSGFDTPELADEDDLLKEPLLPFNSSVFKSMPLTEPQKQEILGDVESLKIELNRGSKGPAQVVAGIEGLKTGLDNYAKKLINESKQYKLAQKTQIVALKLRVENSIENEQINKTALLEKVLKLATQQSKIFSQSSYQRLLKLADASKDLALEELTQLLATNKLKDLYIGTQGRLDLEQVKSLKISLFKTLLISTYITHALAYLNALKKLEKLIDSGKSESSEEFQSALGAVINLGHQRRAYTPSSHVEYLMLEQYMGFLLRPDQIATLDALNIKDGKVTNEKALGGVIEMIMGSGKTAVLLPMLSILNSKDEWLNIVMLPESLIASMSRKLSQQLETAFGRSVDVIEISRATPMKESDLRYLHDRLVRAQVEHRTLVTTNSSMQSLFLSYIAALYEFSKGNKAYEKPIEEFVNIFQLLRSHGRLTIDEVDLALDILQSHQFSVGSRIALNETLSSTAFAFYRFIVSHDLGIRWPFLRGSTGDVLSASSYQKIKPKLIELITRDPQLFQGISGLDKTYRYFIEDKQRQNLLVNYLITQNMRNRETLFSEIESTFAKRPGEIDDMKNIVAVLYEEVNQLFLLTATKKLAIHYGPLPKPIQDKKNDESDADFALRESEFGRSKFIAIPYRAGNPVTNSRFGTSLEALNYTIQMQLEQKNYLEQIQAEVEALKELAEREDPRFDARYDALRKGDSVSIYDVDADKIDDWAKRIAGGSETELELALLKNYALPQITTYEAQLQTNAQIYEAMFSSVQGFSGTLWSVDTFPNIFRSPILSDTAEKTFYLLWSQYQQRKRKDKGYAPVKSLNMATLQADFDWAFSGSFIDDGGLFRGIDNSEVAKKMAAETSQDVIYYDKDNNIVVYQEGLIFGGSSIPIEEPQVAQLKRSAYWDKKHTTGSDLKLRLDMSARVSFDFHTLSRDLQQSVWRLRGLDSRQTIDQYLVLSEDLEVIKQNMQTLLNLPELKKFDLGDLILYTVTNQEMRLSDLLFRAVKQKMKNALVREVVNQMFSGEHSPTALIDIFNGVRSLFQKNLADNPYTYAGFPIAAEAKDKVLERERKAILNTSVSQALKDKRFYADNAYSTLESDIEKIIKKDEARLPGFISTGVIDDGLEVEVEMEKEVEKEIEKETEREIEQYPFNAKYKPHDILIWPYLTIEELFTKAYFMPIPKDKIGTNPQAWLKAQGQWRPLIQLSDALDSEGLDWLGRAMSSNLLISLNLAPLHYRHAFGKADNSHYEFDFFSLYHKNLTNLLIMIDRKSDLKIVLIDNNDASQFKTALKKDPELVNQTQAPRELQLALYSLEQGIFRSGRNTVDENALRNNTHFVELLTQIKFLNGELDYDIQEIAYLKTWLKTYDVEKMYQLFSREILKYKQDSKDALKHSPIGKVFEDLRNLRD